MAFTHQETVFNNAGSGTNANVDLAGAPSSGELVVMYVNANGSSQTITPDTDGGASWTLAKNETPSGETARHAKYWKIANASEPSNISATLGSSDRWSIAITVFSSATDAEVDMAAVSGVSSVQTSDLRVECLYDQTISADAVCVISAGKDSFFATSEDYTKATDSFTNVVGNTQNQVAAMTSRVFTSAKTYGSSEEVFIDVADDDDELLDYTYDIAISFVESSGGGGADPRHRGALSGPFGLPFAGPLS